MENESFSVPHLHKIILKIYIQKMDTKINFKKMVGLTFGNFDFFEKCGSHISKDNICPGCSHIFLIFFEVSWSLQR